ncbi:MAG: RNA methyltransferase [Candidatus Omnitrophica bacterium]|nr:RNA methyltransferase [Candidatus Omnitrophota bacterium]MBU4333193.1 RNA methyltransferase [Candidatus Omnitrophota bacterium]
MKLYGKNTVMERLRVDPKSIQKIFVEEAYKGTGNIQKKARQWGVPVYVIGSSKMLKIARNKNTQGVLADVGEYAYIDYDELLENALKKRRCLVFLDGLTDPQNLGAIIRSLACFGKFSVVLPTHDSVSITETVLRVASGGDNYVQVSMVANLSNAIKKAKDARFNIVGSTVIGGEPLDEVKFDFPLGIVIGSEQKGIRERVQDLLDIKVTIPMAAETLSFNAAHATTVLCYEITKQQKNYKKQQTTS